MVAQGELPRVLVVDDDEDHCVMLEIALGHQGYRVLVAHSVTEAVALLTREVVDALVCDLTLGDGTAHDVIRADGVLRPSVCVVLSGFDDEEERERSLAAGYDAHLVKPTSIDVLADVLRSGIRRMRSGVRLAKTLPPADAAVTPQKRSQRA